MNTRRSTLVGFAIAMLATVSALAGESAHAPIPDFVLRKTELACAAAPSTFAPIGCVIDREEPLVPNRW